MLSEHQFPLTESSVTEVELTVSYHHKKCTTTYSYGTGRGRRHVVNDLLSLPSGVSHIFNGFLRLFVIMQSIADILHWQI